MFVALPTAALYGAGMRLGLSAVILALFVAILPRPAPRPLSVAALYAVTVGWDFGATLIWGTGGPSKVRLDFVVSGRAGSWLLLACATSGILAAASSLRAFANAKRRTGCWFAAAFVAMFALWSCAVRYQPDIAVLGLIVGVVALGAAAPVAVDEQLMRLHAERAPRRRLTGFVWAGAVIAASIGFAVWATNHLEHFRDSCPWGMPGEGHPVLVGSLTGAAAMLGILVTRFRSHRPGVLVSLCVTAACVTGGVEFVSWVFIGASHYCFD